MRDDSDRAAYLAFARNALSGREIRSSAYALMSNHAHWVAFPGRADELRQFLHPVHSAFGGWWNRDRQRLGPVWADRPTSIIVTGEEQLARVVAYVHNNPVRAGIVGSADESAWTSHRAYIGEQTPEAWLDVEATLAAMGFSSTSSGRLAFHEYVVSRAQLPRDPRLAGRGPVCVQMAAHLAAAASGASSLGALTSRALLIYVGVVAIGMRRKQLASALGVSNSLVTREFQSVQASPPSGRLVDEMVERALEHCARHCRGAQPLAETGT